ncbi:HDOD domain-containing protein [Pseudodesulfovibrio sp. JC047]|uniref:HDOD domain-containing protein n=1 Tax=Pseudodesulfovibrio sp. JC047 TaxID=2683199 RepID=UPI0013D3497A|nr:HDOD domain-containing protein [Pseudodesulfovibrio sp. JC047]NDV18861.1 HDOD domain-containing protein [Pseudodesulfovibrio sp. JC047]
MADDIVESGTDIETSPEILEAAKKLLVKRFEYIKNPDESLKRLALLGVKSVARDMVRYPEKYTDVASCSALPDVRPLNPLDILRQDRQLPALPQFFLELQRAIASPSTSADDLADIISQDPGLTAFLLRMVNSAFYSLPMQIDTISRAVTVVGFNQLSTLAVGTSVISVFKNIPEEVLDMEQFWKHSVACGLIARRLCRITRQGDPERAFVAGLLHDIGQLILLQVEPERAAAVHAHARSKQLLLFEEEKALLGFDHATLGGMLLRKWNFPFVLVAAVLEHHHLKADQKAVEPALVHCAETIATGLGIGSSGEFLVQPPDSDAWDAMGLTPGRIDEMVEDLDEELEESFHVLMKR